MALVRSDCPAPGGSVPGDEQRSHGWGFTGGLIDRIVTERASPVK